MKAEIQGKHPEYQKRYQALHASVPLNDSARSQGDFSQRYHQIF